MTPFNRVNTYQLITFILSILIFYQTNAVAEDSRVWITDDLPSIAVMHQGKLVTIKRNPSPNNTINPRYAKTSRPCPPFCIQPANIAAGVDTIGELELLNYLKQKRGGDSSVLIIDSRTPDWVEKGTIPGTVNIPWTLLKPEAGADPFQIADILEQQFGASQIEGLWDFSGAKTLVLFCNGPWCGQSPSIIKTLLRFGYPAMKIKWYRGGMQSWESLGLTVVH